MSSRLSGMKMKLCSVLQGVCNVKQQQSSQLSHMTGSLGYQTSACSAQNCNNNGMLKGTCKWVQLGSSHKVTSRQCDKCPAGQPHIWTARVQDRTRGTLCPYCSNKRVCVHNSLATIAPEALRYWDYSKDQKAPEQVVAGSNFKAEWKCPTCNLEWQADVYRRARRNTGCPKCSRANKVMQSQPTFLEAQPACLAEWDFERNDAEDIYPRNATLGSSKQVHWICSCCPRGQPHRWTAMPNNRIGQGHRCAVCAGKQVCVCNSLESLCPLVASEFDVDKNGFAPSGITACSGKKVWWRKAKRGSWRQGVNVRTDKRQ